MSTSLIQMNLIQITLQQSNCGNVLFIITMNYILVETCL